MNISEVSLATHIHHNVSTNFHVQTFNASMNEVLADNVINSANFPLFESDDPYEYKDFPCHPQNKFFNCSKDDFLKFARGPQRLPSDLLTLVSWSEQYVFIRIIEAILIKGKHFMDSSRWKTNTFLCLGIFQSVISCDILFWSG